MLIMAAAQLDELKRMVGGFRIAELQTLLGYAGKPKTGKKGELLDRTLSLLRNPSYSLMTKIKELHLQRLNKPTATSISTMYQHRAYSDHFSGHLETSYNQVAPHSVPEQEAPEKLNFVVLPFYDHLEEIVPPTVLHRTNVHNRKQESPCTFKLSPAQIDHIQRYQHWEDGIMENHIQVQLRFCSCEKITPELKDHYPPCLYLTFNGKVVNLPNVIPTSKQGIDPRRPPRPLDLTIHCRFHSCNNLYVAWSLPLPNEPDLPKRYCYSINLVRKRTAKYLTDRVVERDWRDRSVTEATIKTKLSDDGDEIALTSLKVSLLCPLGKMRMSLPCVATTCDHIQCFDAALFLMMNEKKPTWNCPVCDQSARYQDLIVDQLFVQICKEAAGDYDEILFSPDGSWTPFIPISQRPNADGATRTESSIPTGVSPVKVEPSVIAPSGKEVDIIVISDSDSDDDDDSIQPVRANKRPISAISSDSSLGIHSISPTGPAHGSLARWSPDRITPVHGSPSRLSSPCTPDHLPRLVCRPTQSPVFDMLPPTAHQSMCNGGSSYAPPTVPVSPPPSSQPQYNSILNSNQYPFNNIGYDYNSTSMYNRPADFGYNNLPKQNSQYSNYPSYPNFMASGSFLDSLDRLAAFNLPQTRSHPLDALTSSALFQSSTSSSSQPTTSSSIVTPQLIDFNPRYTNGSYSSDSPLLDDSDIIPL